MITDSHDQPSDYRPGTSLGQAAHAHAASFLAAAAAGTLTQDGALAREARTCITWTLGLGGPTYDVTVVFQGDPQDGEVVEGWFTYYEPAGNAALYLNAHDAERIAAGLDTFDDGEN